MSPREPLRARDSTVPSLWSRSCKEGVCAGVTGVGVCGSEPAGSSPAGPRGLWFMLAAGLEKRRACALSFLPPGAEDCSQEAGLGCSSSLPHRVLPPLRWNQGGDASPFLSHVLEKAGWLRFPRSPPPPPQRARALTHTHTHIHTHTHTHIPPPTTTSKGTADSFSPEDPVPGQMPVVG